MDKIQSVRGTKDLFAEEYNKHEAIINIAKRLAEIYGYQGLATPVIEFSTIFKRSLGEASDVVGKEMYSFLDKSGEEITLRPEFTAAICRAYISNGFKQLLPLKLFSYGPLFRYERPQKGRQRQFHQLNYEYLGMSSPAIDAELIALGAALLSKLGVLELATLELNSLGCSETRKKYQKSLVEYLQDYKLQLSHDSQMRLEKNPLRILDSKDEADKAITAHAPKIHHSFTQESTDFFLQLQEYLDLLEIKYQINPNLVRGLDYYNHTAFEFTTTSLGAQGTILGGGRYNGLVKLLGGDDTEGIGFAAGIERLALLSTVQQKPERKVAILPLTSSEHSVAMKIANELRSKDIPVIFNLSYKFDKALKEAVKSDTKYAIFIGADELKNSCVKIKDLDGREETIIDIAKLSRYIIQAYNK